MRSILLALLAALVAISALAAAPSASAPEPTSAPGAAELAVARAQLETTKQFQDSFMSMAQWTLGSAIAVALALGAFAWRTNKANYERDREAIQREAKALATELRSELRTEFQSESAKALEALSSKERTIQESIERTLTKQIAALTSKIKDVENGALDLRESALEREADEAVKSGNFRWAARQYCELLELHVRRDMDEYFASVVLDKLRDIAKRPDALLDTEAVTRIVKTLKDLPERHHAACEPLVELLKKKLA